MIWISIEGRGGISKSCHSQKTKTTQSSDARLHKDSGTEIGLTPLYYGDYIPNHTNFDGSPATMDFSPNMS